MLLQPFIIHSIVLKILIVNRESGSPPLLSAKSCKPEKAELVVGRWSLGVSGRGSREGFRKPHVKKKNSPAIHSVYKIALRPCPLAVVCWEG